MRSAAVIRALSALAHPSRLDVFRLLVKRGPEGFSPGDLGDRLGIPGPTLSFHLKELTQAGLIQSRREGRHLFYSAGMDQMNAVIAFLTENCCSLGSQESTSCLPAAATRGRRSA